MSLDCNTFTVQDGKGQEMPRAPQSHPLGMFGLFVRVAASLALGFWQSQVLQRSWIV